MQTKLNKINVAVRGKIGNGTDPLTNEPVVLVYQRVRKGLGNIPTHGNYDLQLRRQPKIIDKKSPAQLQGRARIAAATAAWHQLSEAERQDYRKRAKSMHMTGFNLYIKEFCKQHPVSEF